MGDTFHQAAIAKKCISVVINKFVAWTVELRRENFFSQRHTDGVADTLTQRASSCFHARRITIFGVPRGLGVQLAEILYFLDRQVVAREVQQ